MKEQSYGAWLRHQRQLRGITQDDLERDADLSHKYVSKVENGRLKLPTDEVRGRIHKVFGTTEEDLVSAGVLSRLTFGGKNPVYLPRHLPDSLDEHEDAYPWDKSGISPSLVMESIRAAAMDVVWTKPMLDSIVKQIEAYRDLQQGRFNLELLSDRRFDDWLEEVERERQVKPDEQGNK